MSLKFETYNILNIEDIFPIRVYKFFTNKRMKKVSLAPQHILLKFLSSIEKAFIILTCMNFPCIHKRKDSAKSKNINSIEFRRGTHSVLKVLDERGDGAESVLPRRRVD